MLLPSFEASDFYEHLEPVELAYASLLRTWKFSFLKDDVEDSLPHGNMFPSDHGLSLCPLLVTSWITRANMPHNP